MVDETENQEIEVSVQLLGCAYAALILALIIIFAGHIA
jgi:hypothetical protein